MRPRAGSSFWSAAGFLGAAQRCADLPCASRAAASACSVAPRAVSCVCNAASTGSSRSLALGGSLGEQALLLGELFVERLAPAREFRQALAARALRETGFLRAELGDANALAAALARHLRLVDRVPDCVALRHRLVETGALGGDAGVDRGQRVALLRVLVAQRTPLLADLCMPALRRFARLPELHQLELQVVAAALL
jgi:hypothetical protein